MKSQELFSFFSTPERRENKRLEFFFSLLLLPKE